MSRVEPKYRRPLNPKQLHLLEIVYKFRFLSAESLAKDGTKTQIGSLRKRLNVLADQAYIGRNYDGSYRLQNKPASYFLLPRGIAAIKHQKLINPNGLRATYKDKSASPPFIDHCLMVSRAYRALSRLYGDKLKAFITRTELAASEQFPSSKPDAYLITKAGASYFVDIFDESVPHFAYRRKLLAYINYFDDEWLLTDDSPALLIICATSGLEARLKRTISRIISDIEPDLGIFMTTLSKLETAASVKGVWEQISDPDSDV